MALQHQRRAWWLAPTILMASQVWRDLKNSLHSLTYARISETEKRIDIAGGGMIAVRSAHHPDSLRGEGLDLAVLDEAAYMQPRVWQEIVRPMLTTTRGGALFLSTPLGKNWFYDLFRIGMDNAEDEYAAFHFSTASNPLIAAEEMESVRRRSTEHIWNVEYLAHFSDESGAVFRGVRQAVQPRRQSAPIAGHSYIAGVDWGRSHDFTVIAIIDATERRLVALDRFNEIGWALQRGRLRALAQRWGAQVIWAESNSIGAPNIEALQAEGLPVRGFATTAKSKSPLIEALALALERRQLWLLDDPVLLGELASYALERLPGGGYRYSAPAGMHDDTVIALALAWHGVMHSGARFDFA
ncbi:MAG: terminase family protein [Chloroflexota bacterium]|nr:terminase family protein [Chloroflexota bacterium]MCY3581377.1 terminase family protein [Chloroflexota bacterium]MDE2651969.1 terminase family protein [Chloroflexota bacterium]